MIGSLEFEKPFMLQSFYTLLFGKLNNNLE